MQKVQKADLSTSLRLRVEYAKEVETVGGGGVERKRRKPEEDRCIYTY
jgi:hypothetical protein